jgi:ABC-type branched-subunit amino acid transport system permease subunit
MDNWNYIWAAIAVNFLLVYIVPRLIKKPTGIQVLDDTVLFLNSQKGFLLASSIIVGLVTYLAHSWVDSQTGTVSSSPIRDVKY